MEEELMLISLKRVQNFENKEIEMNRYAIYFKIVIFVFLILIAILTLLL